MLAFIALGPIGGALALMMSSATGELNTFNNASNNLKNTIGNDVGNSLSQMTDSMQKLSNNSEVSGLQLLTNMLDIITTYDFSENSPFKKLVVAINEIGEAVSKIPDSKMISFISNMDSLSTSIPSITAQNTDKLKEVSSFISSPVEPSKIENATKFANASKDYFNAQKDSRAVSNDALVSAVREALKTDSGDQAQARVVLKLEGKEIASAVLPHLNRKFSSSNRGVM
jgi:hypothetical protein